MSGGLLDISFSEGGGSAAAASGYADPPARVGFFTDTSLCIGCKACEVACKEWNGIPEDGLNFTGDSFDNTSGLGADSWRHVAFIEQRVPLGGQDSNLGRGAGAGAGAGAGNDAPSSGDPGAHSGMFASGDTRTNASGKVQIGGGDDGALMSIETEEGFRWLMSSDVCKHCTHSACLDVCPTGALFRTEFGTVVVQEDVCNGCGYCVPACPFGVIDQRPDDGRVWKCTMCYDRLGDGLEPACAKACPTNSIQFGELDELRARAGSRVEQLREAGVPEARLYGDDPSDGVGGFGAFFLLLDEPQVYGLPPAPVACTHDLPDLWKRAGVAAVALGVGISAIFVGSGRAGPGARPGRRERRAVST